MNELKFKLYDKDGNLIGYENHKKNEYGCYQIYQTSLRGDWDDSDEINVRLGSFIAATYKAQFTGKQDSEGTGVYNGDIVEFCASEWGDDQTNKFEVQWNDNLAAWDFGGGSTSEMEYRRVIGNIYQHKDLLK